MANITVWLNTKRNSKLHQCQFPRHRWPITLMKPYLLYYICFDLDKMKVNRCVTVCILCFPVCVLDTLRGAINSYSPLSKAWIHHVCKEKTGLAASILNLQINKFGTSNLNVTYCSIAKSYLCCCCQSWYSCLKKKNLEVILLYIFHHS